jgi:hypothetical protein
MLLKIFTSMLFALQIVPIEVVVVAVKLVINIAVIVVLVVAFTYWFLVR